LKMLDEGSPTPTLLLMLLIVGTGGAAASLIAASLTSESTAPWEAVTISVVGGAAMVVLAVTIRAIAAARPEHAALALGRPIWALGKVGLIVIAPLLWLERSIVGLLAPRSEGTNGQPENELRLLVESVEDARQLEADEREMIAGVFGMS